jgi:hypothetical protein
MKMNEQHLASFHKKMSSDTTSQMIVLMGIILAVSVFVVSSIPSEISDLGATVVQERSHALLSEFMHLKIVFGSALQWNVASEIEVDAGSGDIEVKANIYDVVSKINNNVKVTGEKIQALLLPHDQWFRAECRGIQYSHTTSQGHVYTVLVHLSLKDITSALEQNIPYSIVCKEYLPT